MLFHKRFAPIALAAILTLFSALPRASEAADAEEAVVPIVKGIDVRGLKRIDEGAVRGRISQAVGERLDAEKVSNDIKAIFGMGYFDDVRAEIEPFEGGVDLIYTIAEKPTVRSIEFFGNAELDDDKLMERVTISMGAIADTVLIQDNASAIKKLYEEEGYPLVNVVPVLRKLRDQLLLTYLIEEGPKVKVRDIKFEGNENIKAGKIKKAMETKEWWWLSVITGSGRYEKERMKGDLAKVRDLYFDNGFLEVVVSEPVVEMDETKEWMDIGIRIAEGTQYTVSSLAFSGNKVLSEDELRTALDLAPGDVFSKKTLSSDTEDLTDMYGERGYALAGVYPDVVPDKEKAEASVLYKINEGEKFTIGRVDITGNVKTRDKVIRREVRLSEGDDYNSKLLKRSYQRILNLKYFDQVRLKPVPRVEAREMDIDIDVEERATGSVMLGVGYSSVEKFVTTAEYTQGNLGGRGQTLKLKTEFGNVSTTFEVSFTEPYLFDKEVAFTAGAYRKKEEYTSYNKKATGGTLNIGKSLGEYWKVGAEYQLENAEVTDIDEDASSIVKEQEGTRLTSAITPGITRDTRDNFLDPHAGSKNQAYFTFAGLGGDNKFYKWGVDSAWYVPVSKRTTLAPRARYNQANGLFGEELPLYERYYVGGVTTLRGQRNVGPEDEEGVYIGGKKRLLFNLDYIFPLLPEMKLNGVVFADSGSAFDKFEDLVMRTSTGVGVRWISPIGPIELEWAYNINPEEDDDKSRFEFLLGTFF